MLLSVQALKKQFGVDIILEDVSFRLERREKVALVGRNGAGKTTLLKILTGDLERDGGSVQWERGASVGYLSQMALKDTDATVLEVATEAREHLAEIAQRLAEIEKRMEAGSTAEDLEEFALLHEHFHAEGGYSVETDLKVVLNRLGFEEAEFSKRVSNLSGGEKTRLALAKLLLEEPDLLILDEPTNHLDLDAIEWLEGWINGYGGTVIVVSHDRVFLQNVAKRVIELREGKARSFPGSFDKYLQLAKEEDERLAAIAEKQQQEMAALDEYVRRFMNSQRTAQARGRLKMLEKMRASAITTPRAEKDVKAFLKPMQRAGDIVLEGKGLSMAFGSQRLFENLNWTVRWGDRWGVIGANGAGKSTLVKIMLGRLEPTDGECRIGSNVQLGWFSQDADFLDPDATPLEAVCAATGLEFGPARSLLGRFLISGEDALRPIRTLSGGERVKVALAIITSHSPNVLVLDEPTNHLDIASREALASVLKEYIGTLVLISHDRWLLEQVTAKTLDLRHGAVTEYGGSYTEYRAWTGRQTSKTSSAPRPISHVAASEPTLSHRELSKEIQRVGKQVEVAEEKIAQLETEMAQLESKMSALDGDVVAMSVRHGELQKLIATAMEVWTDAGSRLEALESMRRG